MRKLSLVVGACAVLVGTAAALPGAIPPAAALAPELTFTADRLPTWQTNGIVWALAQHDGVVFAGGTFSRVRPPGAAAGTNETVVTNFVALDADTGNPTSCDLDFSIGSGTATVRALAVSPDGSTLYAGGNFASVNGLARSRLAAIDIASCTPKASFTPPSISAPVRALAVTDTAVYFGGDFTSVGGQSRGRFAAVNHSGALQSWAPNADGVGRAIAVAPGGTAVVVGGDFFNVNGAASHALAVTNSTSGANVRTYPAGFIPNTSVVKDLVSDSTGIYTGNEGTGGGVFDGRLALDPATFDQAWRDTCLGATQAVYVYEAVLYSGSHAHDCSSMGYGWYPEGPQRHLLAESVNGPQLLPWFPDTNGGIGESLGPRDIVVAGSGSGLNIWVAGEFTLVNGTAQQGLTRFATTPDTGAPGAPTPVGSSFRAGEIGLQWRASVDSDDRVLTYRVYRDGGTTPIWSGTGESNFWTRNQASFTDTSVAPGSTHSYRVRASDGTNTSALGPAVSVTAATTTSPYPSAVVHDGASLFWRYNEASGIFGVDSSAGNNSALFDNTPTYAVAGGIASDPSRAMTFDGSSDYAHAERQLQTPTTYSVETWFRTTTTRGGKIIGFGNGVPTRHDPPRHRLSSSYDKHIYMTNNGRLIFGVWNGTANALQSQTGLNNGAWHHVVGTQGPSGMRLYVDGVLVGSNSVTTSQVYPGTWRVGGDNLNGWPSRPTSNFFAGTIDETAVYPTVLTQTQVQQHNSIGRGIPVADTTPPTTPTDLGATVTDNDVALAWTASTDQIGVTGYDVHRSGTAGFTPAAANRIATVPSAQATDADRPEGTWYYRVIARDAAGNSSTPSNEASALVEAPPPPPPTTVTLPAVDDTYVNALAPNLNYGTGGSLAARLSPEYTGYLRFTLPDAPAGQVLTGATLNLRSTTETFAGSVDDQTIAVAEDDWVETTMTYNNRAEVVGPTLGTIPGGFGVDTPIAVDLDLDEVDGRLGEAMSVAVTGTAGDNFWFGSSEGTVSRRPSLVLEFSTP